jgi:hypothetical protein
MRSELPGGAWIDGRAERGVTLRPMSGRVEQGMVEQAAGALSWPSAVSGMLAVAVERFGETPCRPELVQELSVGDRQYLMLWLARLLYGDAFWCSARCGRCRSWYDLELRRSLLPVKVAGAGFPFTRVTVCGRVLELRAPNGADQEGLAEVAEDEAIRLLVQRCTVSVDGAAPSSELVGSLGQADLDRIEAALDDLAPDVGTRVATQCPECGGQQIVEVDPFGARQWRAENLSQEIHVIASTYHWSEAEILDLPRERRHRYLGLIDRDRGLHH